MKKVLLLFVLSFSPLYSGKICLDLIETTEEGVLNIDTPCVWYPDGIFDVDCPVFSQSLCKGKNNYRLVIGSYDDETYTIKDPIIIRFTTHKQENDIQEKGCYTLDNLKLEKKEAEVCLSGKSSVVWETLNKYTNDNQWKKSEAEQSPFFCRIKKEEVERGYLSLRYSINTFPPHNLQTFMFLDSCKQTSNES